MKLYVFYFSRVTKEVVRDEVEVEDKPKSYKTPAGYCLPYLEVSKFLKADTDKIYHGAYVSENGDFKKAVIALKHEEAKAEMEKYGDFYRSCFKYTTPTGTVMVP